MADILISKFTTQIPRVGATPATPGFAESEGQDPVAPSGTPQVYTPVTIGSPANGLSINASQVLSIGLASTSATGALSSTDWNTFNGKIGGSIASGQVAFGTGVNTVGGENALWWDSTNDRFGIGTTTPQSGFELRQARAVLRISDSIDASATNQQGSIIQFWSNDASVASGSSGQRVRAEIATKYLNAIGNINSLSFYVNDGTNSAPVERWQIDHQGWFTSLGSTERIGINTTSPTNTLDVNGTARIRTISNLGSAATSVLVPSATGVISLRTLAEFASDAGLTNFWTLAGSGIYRNSQVAIGRTTMGPSNAALTINSLGSTAGNFAIICYDVTGTTLGFTASKEGFIGSGNITPTTNFESTRNTSGSGASIICRQTNTAGTASIALVNSAGSTTYIGLNSPSFASGLGNIFFLGMTTTGTNIVIGPNLANTASTTERTIFRNGGFSASFDVAYFDINGLFFSDAKNIAFGTTTGTKIGTATNQKIGFFNATPIVQPSGDILVALANLGLIASPTITQVDQFAVKTTASADQTLPSGTLTILDYDSTLLNNSTATYTVGTDGRITINTTGVYTITAGVVIEADAVTALESAFLGIFRNGDLVAISSINTTIAAGAQSGLSTSTILSLTATDIIDCRALVNSVGGVANGLARRLGTLLGANATQVNSLSITKNSM